MKEKNPALSTGCWCLGVKMEGFGSYQSSRRYVLCLRTAWPWTRENIFTGFGQTGDESHVRVWTAVCTSLSELLRSGEKVQRLFISQHVKDWAVCEWRIRALLSGPHWLSKWQRSKHLLRSVSHPTKVFRCICLFWTHINRFHTVCIRSVVEVQYKLGLKKLKNYYTCSVYELKLTETCTRIQTNTTF